MTSLKERQRTYLIRTVNINLNIKVKSIKRYTRCNCAIMKNNIVRIPLYIYIFEMFLFHLYMRLYLFIWVSCCYIFLMSFIGTVVKYYFLPQFGEFLLNYKSKTFRGNHTIHFLALSNHFNEEVQCCLVPFILKRENQISVVLSRGKGIKYDIGLLNTSKLI